jgi:hypothetical protein
MGFRQRPSWHADAVRGAVHPIIPEATIVGALSAQLRHTRPRSAMSASLIGLRPSGINTVFKRVESRRPAHFPRVDGAGARAAGRDPEGILRAARRHWRAPPSHPRRACFRARRVLRIGGHSLVIAFGEGYRAKTAVGGNAAIRRKCPILCPHSRSSRLPQKAGGGDPLAFTLVLVAPRAGLEPATIRLTVERT